jgi:N-acetyl-anhydromuramyl-L-alanine amidase AmpD
VPTIELERTLVKSPPELWDEIASEEALGRWLGEVRLSALDPPSRIEWSTEAARGVIELEASGWGTRVRAQAESAVSGGFWDRFKPQQNDGELARELEALLDALGSSTLKKT